MTSKYKEIKMIRSNLSVGLRDAEGGKTYEEGSRTVIATVNDL